jgi:hypothetical protein
MNIPANPDNVPVPSVSHPRPPTRAASSADDSEITSAYSPPSRWKKGHHDSNQSNRASQSMHSAGQPSQAMELVGADGR